MISKVIKTEEDYNQALARIENLMDAEAGTPAGDELELLSVLVGLYEDRHYHIDLPEPVEAIKFRMEQMGLRQRDMIPYFGSKSKTSEVLNGKKPLTISMMRMLHNDLGVPAEVMLQPKRTNPPESLIKMDFSKFPLHEMAKRGWIVHIDNMKQHADEIMTAFFQEAGGEKELTAAHCRHGLSSRYNKKANEYAMTAWRLHVIARSRKANLPRKFKRDLLSDDKLRDVAQLSRFDKGPLLAREFLNKLGIHVIIESHLPKTYLDGAAMLLADRSPVIALTLRYDRIDHFWFTLLHELAHVYLHLRSPEDCFLDDLELKITDLGEDNPEKEADKYAEEITIPKHYWEERILGKNATLKQVQSWADELKIHPALIIGRIRYHTGNYRLFPRHMGTGSVRRLFQEISN